MIVYHTLHLQELALCSILDLNLLSLTITAIIIALE